MTVLDTHGISDGSIVKHFKRDLVQRDSDDKTYLYKVLYTNAVDSETGDRYVVYQALYGQHRVFIRPKDMFFSAVDSEKYPNIKQKYRFELAE